MSDDIRDVPEPPVKLEGWIGMKQPTTTDNGCDGDDGPYLRTSYIVPQPSLLSGYELILNLALVSERCPEAITKVTGEK
jgi:hypothetical protein